MLDQQITLSHNLYTDNYQVGLAAIDTSAPSFGEPVGFGSLEGL